MASLISHSPFLPATNTVDSGFKGAYPHNNAVISRPRDPAAAWLTVGFVLQNAQIGSRYAILRQSNNEVLASGTISSDPQTIQVSWFGPIGDNTVLVKLRKGSSSQKYQPFTTVASVTPTGFIQISPGTSVFVVQIPDSIA